MMFIAIVVALVFPWAAAALDWVELKPDPLPFTVQVLETDANRTVLSYSVNGYSISEVTIDGQAYTLFKKLPRESMIEEAGYPRLPRINRAIVIPDEGVMGYKILSADYIEMTGIGVAPSRGHLPRTVDPAEVPYTFADLYAQDTFSPGDLVTLRHPHILRDLRGLMVELNAFQYNPAARTLRIYTDVTIEVKKIAPGGDNVLLRRQALARFDPQFYKFYRRHFINFDNLDYPQLFEAGELLVICYDDFMDVMAPLVEWKRQKGIPTNLVPSSEAGSNPQQILSYIRNVYLTSDLCYLLLVGDAAQIPTFMDSSDPVYSLLSGSDSYPEIFVGRFSAETPAQVQTQVERTLNYEKYPDPALDWYHRGMGVADEDGPTNDEHYDFQHITQIANKLLRYTYTLVDSVYTTFGGNAAMISHKLNQGRSILNYAGHGRVYGIGPPNYTVDDVDNLVNDNRLPHIVAIACDVGDFVDTTCFAEAWLRATNNTSGAPTGAIGAYMSRTAQSWLPPYDMQDEGVDLLVNDSVRTFGGLCFNGSGLMIDLHGSAGENEFRNWTIFGDPSLYLRGDTPYGLIVNHDTSMAVGTPTFDVEVSGPGGPLEEALVCGMNPEIYASGFTSADGQVTLNFDPAPMDTGTFTLTVTGWNALPYIAEVDIVITPIVESENVSPSEFALLHNHPNPFNSSTTISFTLAARSFVKLEVYDIYGRNLGKRGDLPLLDGWQDAGEHEIVLDGSELTSGIYIIHLQTEFGQRRISQARKMLLLK